MSICLIVHTLDRTAIGTARKKMRLYVQLSALAFVLFIPPRVYTQTSEIDNRSARDVDDQLQL